MAEDDKAKELEALQASVEKLEAKNRELVAEVRKAKGSTNEEAAKLAGELDDAKAEILKLAARAEKAEKKAAQVEADSAQAIASEKSAVTKLLIDNGLDAALDKANVKPEHKAAVKALLREKGVLQIETEGDVRRAVAILKKDGKETKSSLEDFVVKDFAASDEGKAFVAAAASSGTGAQGGGKAGGAGPKTMTEAEFKALDQAGRMAASKDHVKIV